uniref:Putative trna nucleotidyltransferase/polya polymerase n=1 Tax=Corethrella appendiculata TaxID=1370023 RepID=U5EXI2_9DIPT
MEANLTARPDPIVAKLESTAFKSIFTNELYSLIDVFQKYKYELRVAGGAVRDILLDQCPKDIDFATTATPSEMKEMFTKENIRLVNMNGEKHGTITPRINDKENFEVTTLRIDLTTDGRHAEVLFTTDWQLDANRRDLTINSMFLGFDGTVYDYYYGLDDLKKRRIAFVGDPDKRIKEDYLRILRYFRFYGRIADTVDNHDAETLRVISKNINGLERISGERIWSELKKILQGKFGYELVLKLLDCGAGKFIGIPEKANIEEFQKVYSRTKFFDEPFQPLTLLSALLNKPEEAIHLNLRLKFSVFERELTYFIVQNRKEMENIDEILLYKKLCFKVQGGGSVKVRKEYILELLKYYGKTSLYLELKQWEIPVFPIKGNQLKDFGCPAGPVCGVVMNRLRDIWSDSNFQLSNDELVSHLPELFNELNIIDGKIVK